MVYINSIIANGKNKVNNNFNKKKNGPSCAMQPWPL